MLPISLRLQGIYSYIEEQVIDFKSLTATGLFGIFGQVGAGKSSIIEAIVVALYGKNERLDNANFWYNMLNLNCNKAIVVFCFEYEQRTYRFEVQWKRNSKHFDDVKGVRYAYLLDGDEWKSIEPNAKDILGLSYEHFKRTTIIPQGKFREFLELKPSERTQMIKEIFELYRFDLKDKINYKFKQVEDAKLVLDGVLQTFNNLDPEQIAHLQQEQEKVSQELLSINEKWSVANRNLEAYKVLESQWKQLLQLQISFSKYEEELPTYQEEEKRLQAYIKAYQAFNTLLDQRKQLEKQQVLLQKEQELGIQTQGRLQTEQQQNQIKYKPIKASFDKLQEKRQHIDELATVKKIIELQQANKHLKDRVLQGHDHIQHQIQQREAISEELQLLKNAINQRADHHLTIPKIQELEHWIWKKEQLDNEWQLLKDEEIKLNRQLEELQEECMQKSVSISQLHLLDEALTAIKEQQKQHQQQEQSLLVQIELNTYAQNLKDGEPCPLCGATHHENITTTDSVTALLKPIKEQLTQLEAQERKLISLQKWAWNKEQEQRMWLQQLATIKLKIEQVETLKLAHQEAFLFPPYTISDWSSFETDKQVFLRQEEQFKINSSNILLKQANLDKVYANLQKFEDGIKEINNQIQQNDAAIKVHFQSTRNIDANYYIQQSLTDISHQQQVIQEQIQTIESAHESLFQMIQKAEQELLLANGKIEAQNLQLLRIKEELGAIQLQLDKLLGESTLTSLTMVEDLLSKPIDITATQQKMAQFFQQYHTIHNQIVELQRAFQTQEYDEVLMVELETTLRSLTENKELLLQQVAQIQARITDLQSKYEQYKIQKLLHEQASTKLQHLNELKKLFMGDRFIEFISGTYLQQLCEYANIRFHRLSKNQLSLSINEKMEFEVIDYLNGGKSRGIKTLSGGQAFQASLCLALALAESVQAKSKQEQHFFFIDEGFGTQDKQSIPTIFETLLSISNENRIVGVISHVEELQENISRYLVVEKTEHGSQIEQF